MRDQFIKNSSEENVCGFGEPEVFIDNNEAGDDDKAKKEAIAEFPFDGFEPNLQEIVKEFSRAAMVP
jgi:hypothetical protein